jgi:SAM-dependent methyltransferase
LDDRVSAYLARANEFPHRVEGEDVLLEHVPSDVRRVLDLGAGDGRLLAMLQADRPQMLGVGLDFSAPMLRAARERFADDDRVELVEHDLSQPLPPLGRFDAVVSSMAILEHERKRSLYGEVFDLLEPGGSSPTSSTSPPRLTRARLRRRRLLLEVARDGAADRDQAQLSRPAENRPNRSASA